MDEILAAFGELNFWRQGSRRARHKPLLVLLALGEWQRGRVLVSADVCGDGEPEMLGRFHGGALRPPARAEDRPAAEFLTWHREQVFRGRERS